MTCTLTYWREKWTWVSADTTSYTYYVTAVDAAGNESVASNTTTVTTHTTGTWPDATNTGYLPTGVTLTEYGGVLIFGGTQTTNITLDSMHIVGMIQVYGSAAVTVTLTRCKVSANIDIDTAGSSLHMTDCEVDAGLIGIAAVGFRNLTLTRCNLHGGPLQVNASQNALVQDSYLHGATLYPTSADHLGAFLCSGGDHLQVTHNYLACNTPDNGYGGGASSNLQLFGDFATLDTITVDGNCFAATTGGYAASFGYNPGKPFGDTPTHIVVSNNVFERGVNGKGGVYGTTTSFLDTEPTNQWSNNTWRDTGAQLPPNV